VGIEEREIVMVFRRSISKSSHRLSRASRSWIKRTVALPLVFLFACQSQGACQKIPAKPSPDASVSIKATDAPIVLLAGNFERVSRATQGHAEIVKNGSKFELILTNVSVAADSMVRVYLVGHDRASSTFLVDATELKYDMAALESGAARQVIDLPSEPDSRLRSVVLYSPSFGINLGFAPLRAK
jgi:hypothetical protein